MLEQQDIVKVGTLQKLASTGFIISAVLLIVFNILAPRPADFTNMQSVLTTKADQKFLSLLGQLMLALAFLFLGVSMARSAVYLGWLGWVAVVLGIVMVAIVGIPKFFMGYTSALLLIFDGLALLTTLWILAVGIWIARRAW